MRLIFAFLFISYLFTACSTFVPVKRTLPPDIKLSTQKGKFLFISRFSADSLPFSNDNKIEVFRIGYNSFIEGLSAGFDSSRRYNLTPLDGMVEKTAVTEPGLPLDKVQVNNICQGQQVNYLLALDAYNLYFDQEVEVVKQEDGTKERTAYYDLVAESFISMYDEEGKLLDQFRDEQRIAHDERSVISGLLAVGPSMGKADQNAVLISSKLGRDFIQKFYPRVIFEQRQFYHTKEFKNAYRSYLSENWDTTESELLKITESQKPEIAGRAAYNLAVLYENINRPEDVDYWYRKATNLLGNKVPILK
ncbi:hypothetical protein JMN32_14605 [Fulvivirga sp. 29W222]|uniref:Uncharacterized protein n=1 Tax=Fulvivirga marina TaxID=2494733 RepID=A0A937FZV8_9BACT|nr:DUF6340 family protein [Fulvivirga marina]MBL6447546.1 hypothetical protein [Fulvivirga marina]